MAKNSFVADVSPISGIIDHYFIMELFKRNWDKKGTNIQTIYHFTGSCQKRV